MMSATWDNSQLGVSGGLKLNSQSTKAEGGGRILIYPGRYRETFPKITNPVELLGQGSTNEVVIECELATDVGIEVYGKVGMKNLTVLGTTQRVVLIVYDSGHLTLQDCAISSYNSRFAGVYSWGSLSASGTRIEGFGLGPGVEANDRRGIVGCSISGTATFDTCAIRSFSTGVSAFPNSASAG
jgi:hypothetical protein